MKLLGAALVAAALAAQSASAWTFEWEKADGTKYVGTGRLDKGCTAIQHARGKAFDWRRPNISIGAWCCINLYDNGNCKGDPKYFTCSSWSNVAESDLWSYSVNRCII
jgi:hypothetical protein